MAQNSFQNLSLTSITLQIPRELALAEYLFSFVEFCWIPVPFSDFIYACSWTWCVFKGVNWSVSSPSWEDQDQNTVWCWVGGTVLWYLRSRFTFVPAVDSAGWESRQRWRLKTAPLCQSQRHVGLGICVKICESWSLLLCLKSKIEGCCWVKKLLIISSMFTH